MVHPFILIRFVINIVQMQFCKNYLNCKILILVILLDIFYHTVPPTWSPDNSRQMLFDCPGRLSMFDGFRSSWHVHRKNIVVVCLFYCTIKSDIFSCACWGCFRWTTIRKVRDCWWVMMRTFVLNQVVGKGLALVNNHDKLVWVNM